MFCKLFSLWGSDRLKQNRCLHYFPQIPEAQRNPSIAFEFLYYLEKNFQGIQPEWVVGQLWSMKLLDVIFDITAVPALPDDTAET